MAEAIAKPGVAEALGRQGVAEAFARPGVAEALNRAGMIEALTRTNMLEALANPAMVKMLNNAAVARRSRPRWRANSQLTDYPQLRRAGVRKGAGLLLYYCPGCSPPVLGYSPSFSRRSSQRLAPRSSPRSRPNASASSTSRPPRRTWCRMPPGRCSIRRVPQKTVRLQPDGARGRAARRLSGLRQRRRHVRAAQQHPRADRAAELRVRDDHRQRAHEHHHEPRARARGVDGSGGAARPDVPEDLSAARSCPSRSSRKPSCISI